MGNSGKWHDCTFSLYAFSGTSNAAPYWQIELITTDSSSTRSPFMRTSGGEAHDITEYKNSSYHREHSLYHWTLLRRRERKPKYTKIKYTKINFRYFRVVVLDHKWPQICRLQSSVSVVFWLDSGMLLALAQTQRRDGAWQSTTQFTIINAETPVQYQLKLYYGMIHWPYEWNFIIKKQQYTKINLVNSYANIYDTAIIESCWCMLTSLYTLSMVIFMTA